MDDPRTRTPPGAVTQRELAAAERSEPDLFGRLSVRERAVPAQVARRARVARAEISAGMVATFGAQQVGRDDAVGAAERGQ